MTEELKKAIIEMQEDYEFNWKKGNFDVCKGILYSLLLINKHVNDISDWRIRFEGSIADRLINVLR